VRFIMEKGGYIVAISCMRERGRDRLCLCFLKLLVIVETGLEGGSNN
jgi:hypothetical protein